MCGIAGFVGANDHELLVEMTRRLVHRGPDDEGFFESPMVSLGHRRLSVIDIEHGHQPMSSPDGHVHIAYNGEVYNFRELRQELEADGLAFRTASDTEVLLRAYERWGTGCFARCNGMWAAAIWDEREPGSQRLVLARDHFGIKPLYLARAGARLLFASEIKALLADPALVPAVDDDRLAEYVLRGLHDHDERTFFAGVSQLAPGTVLVVDPADPSSGTTERYFDPRLTSRPAAGDPSEFASAFTQAVERRLVADVTVGTCLSGGLDSTSIVCTMTSLLRSHVRDSESMGERLKTFSAVFDGDPIDEQAYIAPVLEMTGADGSFVRPRAHELMEDLPRLVWHQDEPTVSSGPYAQFRVMELAKGSAKVLLDGQAGDELLAGYVPYQYVYLRQLLRERRLRELGREVLAARDVLSPLVRRRIADRGRRALDVSQLLRGPLADPARAGAARRADRRSQDDLKTRLLQDLLAYSLPSLLRYEDRNSMAHSIESRVPFLDQELVERVLAMPADAIIRDGWSRWVLRQAMAGVIPEPVRLRRKKIGFTTPEMRWLRAERAFVQGVFRSPSFCSRRLFDGPAVARAFARCCDHELEESPFFWRALNIEVWHRVFLGLAPLAPRGDLRAGSLQAAGDEEAVALAGTPEAAALRSVAMPNGDRHLFMAGPDGRGVHARVPVATPLVGDGDDIDAVASEALAACPVPLAGGDVVAVSEKVVAVSQGRSFPAREVRPSGLATALSRFVARTPAGIGLGIPETMQLAIDEAGAARIVLAAVAGAAGRLAGRRGDFYRVAGHDVNAIDGPTAGTLPPYDTHAKLPPRDPEGVAARLSRSLAGTVAAGGAVGVAVVDANDRGVRVLGASAGVDRDLVAWLFGDNPLGQGREQTPIAILRRASR
jgi:asparagine synthase (glutamine-hydrolysing)